MASGLLGKAAIPATTWTDVYTVPASTVATANIRLVNRDLINPITVKLAISEASGAASDDDLIEPPDMEIPPGGVLEEMGQVMGAGERINVWSSAATLTVRAHGFEKPV